MEMKYPEYDSPFTFITNNIIPQIANQVDDMCLQATYRAGIIVDRDKMICALEQDSERYREAFHRGEETGYAKRDEEIVRCKDCIHYRYYGLSEETVSECRIDHCENPDADWFCADGR